MKKIVKYVEVVEGYEASDGKMFETEIECIEYEYNNLVVKRFSMDHLIEFGTDEVVDVVYIRNAEDLIVVNTYIKNETCYNVVAFDYTKVGTKQLIHWYYDHDGCFAYGTIDDLLREIKNNYEE